VTTSDDDEGFSARLMRLIETMHPADRGPYSYREIARGVSEQGVKMSPTTVFQLASGQRAEPKMRDVQGFAAFFGVPVDYFLDPTVTARVDEQIANVKIARDKDAMTIALRTLALPHSDREAVNNLITALENHQHQPDSSRRRRRREP
jgi:transcriptional regulator with XRE-family HTH domain